MISIFTPTYNRAYTLDRLFNSLMGQTSKNFEWIIVNDGSEDDTEEKVKRYKEQADFNIQYVYQKNQGKHLSTNIGQEIASKELFMCIDSDDWITHNAVEYILKDYSDYVVGKKDIGGMMYLDMDEGNQIIGSDIPNYEKINWLDLVYKQKMTGDKLYIFKTNIIKKYLFYSYPNNNHMPPTYQLYLFSNDYSFFCVNKPLKIIEYLPDGISRNISEKYFTAPENYMYYRKSIHKYIPSFKGKIKNIFHYNITSIISGKKEKHLLFELKSLKITSKLLLPISYIFYLYYRIKNIQKVKKWRF